MKIKTAFVCALAALLLAACASQQGAPVIERSPGGAPLPAAAAVPPPPPPSGPDYYTVKRGDTLYSIALDNGQDYRDVATWNNITNPNVIATGQVLRVRPPTAPGAPSGLGSESGAVVVRPILPPGAEAGAAPGASAPAGAPPAGIRTEPNGAKRPYSDEAMAQAQRESREPARTIVATAPAVTPPPPPPGQPPPPPPGATAPPAAAAPAAPRAVEGEEVAWSWPANGKVIGNFTEGGSSKGVDIAAKVGDPVLAAAPGKVVYSGQGLRGYGRLIIIKHNNEFLSAYAHNSTLLVKEGQSVTRGQKIAEAGNTDSDVPKLHFEIRRQGKPVDPAKFLPAR